MSIKVKVAAAHFAPVFNDKVRTTAKACDIIREASTQGIQLLAFSEGFIPGYPHWCRVIPPNNSDSYYKALVAQAITADGPEIKQLRMAAKRHGIVVSMGFTELNPFSNGSIWNSNILIDGNGDVLNLHRKLVPTFAEKTIHAPGDGAGLKVCDTAVGRVGMLICGENTNPLARFTLMAQSEQIHIASYPSIVPARTGGESTYDLTEGIRIRAAAHAFEAKVFTIVVSSPFDETARNAMQPLGDDVMALYDNGAKAVSLIVDTTGKLISGVMVDDEGFAVAEIDLDDSVGQRRLHDVVGQYNRFDIFELKVNRKRLRPIEFNDCGGEVGIHTELSQRSESDDLELIGR